MERKYDWVVKFKELEYKYYRLAQGVQPKPDEPTTEGAELYIENIDSEPGYFSLSRMASPTYTPNLKYRIDNGKWFEYDTTNLPTIEVPVGSKIYLKGNNPNGFNQTFLGYYTLTLYSYSTTDNCKFNIGGYITSLLALENFNLISNIPAFSFFNLFADQKNLLSAENLITDNITSVEQDSFTGCFIGCTSLVTAPTFSNVTSVGRGGFISCFNSCISLVTAPTFSNVTSVGQDGFNSCFEGCTSLQTIIAPQPSTWDVSSFSDWVSGVPSTGTFIKKYELDIPTGTSGIPEGWEVVEIADPLYIENIDSEAGYFTLSSYGSPTYTPNLNYKVDNGEWFEYDTTTLPRIEVPAGSKIYFQGDNPNGFSFGNGNYSTHHWNFTLYSDKTTSIKSNQRKCNIGGFITSLLSVTDYHLITQIPKCAFCDLFAHIGVVSAEKLITRNITSVGEYSFYQCFEGCTSLVTAPMFENIINVGEGGFNYCFGDCLLLVTAPTFENVTNVERTGFFHCLDNCSSLVISPNFYNVTSIEYYSFEGCFNMCTSLETITAPSPSYWDTPCFENWVTYIPKTGTFYKKAGLTIPSGASGIPEGWTVVEV